MLKHNTQCLEGYRCPKCGSVGPFRMSTECIMEWSDEGTTTGEYTKQKQISDEGHSHCIECDYRGKTEEFDITKKYVADGGTKCPFCQSSDIEGDQVEIDCGHAWQEVTCPDCDAAWTDDYEMVGMTVNERPN